MKPAEETLVQEIPAGTGTGEGPGRGEAPRRTRARTERRDLLLPLLVLLTAGAETAAFLAILRGEGGRALALGLALHVGAALLGRVAARRRRGDLSVVERDLVLLTGCAVPVFGPLVAWAMPRPARKEEPQNAHEVFTSYSEHVKPMVPDHERTLFTGDYDKDMARELDVESYHEVLAHGTTDQKRSALVRLAELGETKHFRLVRKCLLDPEHEVRLYAYSELERASRRFEEEIAQRARELAAHPEAADAPLALAGAYFEYAESGIHDEAMAAWYYRSAERYAGQARRLLGDAPEPVWIQARSFGRLGDFDRAKALLLELSEAQQNLPESCLARAELAFARRDFLAARAELARLREVGAEPPPWLAALEGRST
jgi:hypothetical protein